MIFLVDQQLPPALADWLAHKRHLATHVRTIGLADADDGPVWDYAAAQRHVIVTKDADFAERRQRVDEGPQILWLRVGNTTTPVLFAWLDARWTDIEARLADGESVVEVR